MILTATSRIEGIAILQYHDLVTAEAIVDANVLEDRHQAPRRSARRPHRAARPPPHTAARGLPALNASRERGGTQPDNHLKACTQRRASAPASAHTAARIHRNPGRRPVRTHREQQPRATRQYVTRAPAPSSTPIRTESTAEQDTFPQRTRRGAVSRRYTRPPTAPCTHTNAPLQERAEYSDFKGTTYHPNPPSPPRPASGTPPGIPPRRPSPDRRRVWRAREPASTRRVQRPREPARYAPSEAAPKTRRHAASDGRPRNGRRHAT